MTENKNVGSLSGIKVIDLTRVLSGPFCTMLLADMGAEVIKIEPPKGDNVRNQGDMVDGYSSYFAQFNRNKKSVILDLYKESEKEIFKEGTWKKIEGLTSAFDDADAVIVLTEWDEYSNINWSKVSIKMRRPAWVFDVRSIIDPEKVKNSGINFWRIGDGLQ